ncbi:MerR family DNA-binding transcriptional regulator [Streptomyces sp. NPDC001920]
MPIGVFAQRSGVTSSALRFYADSGLLPPAGVEPISGCRWRVNTSRNCSCEPWKNTPASASRCMLPPRK